MVIKTNIPSVNTNRVMHFHQDKIATNFRNLSSGMRINRAGDDASGMAVSEKMTAQIMGLNRAEMNTYDGVSFLQTAEGYVMQTNKVLKRLRELAVQSANGIYTSEDRMQIEVEISQLVAEVDRIASFAQFNGLNLLTGRYANPEAGGLPTASMWFHVGANMDQNIRAYIGTFTAQALGLRGTDDRISISVSTPTRSNQLIGVLDEGLKTLNKQIADIGAYQNRLDYIAQSLAIGSENLQAARSQIRDVNMAKEISELVKNQILNQSQVAMLAQANQQPQSVLQLLQ